MRVRQGKGVVSHTAPRAVRCHGRRQFVDVAENFPSECRYVLEMLGQVYGRLSCGMDAMELSRHFGTDCESSRSRLEL